ncbi:MAG: 4Fe-4S binding protein [Desulfobacterota bacterium]|nr:4Fe-4S binding protein [Thermodesulfobacteriota bacterium]
MVTIDTNVCLVCGGCIDLCPKAAIIMKDDTVLITDKCIQCKICVQVCPVGAPRLIENAA